MTLDAVVDALSRARFSGYADEYELQDAVERVLRDAGFPVSREVDVAGGRVDLAVESVGIEVKVKGTPARVLEQLRRYARSGRFDALLLVTTRTAHRKINRGDVAPGVPLRIVTVLNP